MNPTQYYFQMKNEKKKKRNSNLLSMKYIYLKHCITIKFFFFL